MKDEASQDKLLALFAVQPRDEDDAGSHGGKYLMRNEVIKAVQQVGLTAMLDRMHKHFSNEL